MLSIVARAWCNCSRTECIAIIFCPRSAGSGFPWANSASISTLIAFAWAWSGCAVALMVENAVSQTAFCWSVRPSAAAIRCGCGPPGGGPCAIAAPPAVATTAAVIIVIHNRLMSSSCSVV